MIFGDIKQFFSFLKPSNIKKWFKVEYLFLNYFWYYTVCAVLALFFQWMFPYNLGFPLILYALLYNNARRYKISLNGFDLLILINIIWICITWLINDYPHKPYLTVRAIMGEMAFMMAYWIARYSDKDYLSIIIEYARKPLVITCIIGVYCFIFEPAWYLKIIDSAVTSQGIYNYTKENVIDQFKLRSIFSGGYVLGYLCAFAIVYELFLVFTKKKKQISHFYYHLLFIFLLVITSILAMMRAPLACTIMGLGIVYGYSVLYADKFRATVILTGIMVLVGGALLFILQNVDISDVEVLISKVNQIGDQGNDFVKERLFLQESGSSLFGGGYGRFNAIAYYKFEMPTIPDGEYMKIISEQGYIGLVLMVTPIVLGVIKALFHFKHLGFELFVLLMLLVCMIGADPLSTSDKHCFLYWLALGQISRFNVRLTKRVKIKTYKNE